MSARQWTEAITSSPGVVAVFDGIGERAAQALCEAIETEIAPLVKQRDDLLAAVKDLDGVLCADHQSWSRDERSRARQKLISARAAIARAEGRQS